MIRLVLFLGSLCILFQAHSQPITQTIKGRVIDTDTKRSLVGANVLISGSEPFIATVTDTNGIFKLLNVPVARQTIQVSYIGYEPYSASDILVSTGKEVILTIELKELVINVEEVRIVARKQTQTTVNTMTSVSARMFSVEESKRYAGGFYDPARMAESFAGVSPTGGESNELVIRGNSPRGLLWRLEGIEIPNPNHFRDGEGGSGGGVNIITSNVITNSDFMTGAFSPEYGNALSGVFDIHLRQGNNERHEFGLQASVVGIEFAAEGPLTKNNNGSYLLNYRFASFSLLEKAGISVSNNDIIPSFQDFVFHINFPSGKAGRFSMFGIGGYSTAGNIAETDSTRWIDSYSRYEELEKHNTGVIGLKHFKLLPDQKTYLKTILSASYERNTFDRAYIQNDLQFSDIFNEQFIYKNYRFSTMLHHKFNSRNRIRAGMIGSSLSYNTTMIFFRNDPEKEYIYVNSKGRTGMLQGYVQWQIQLSEKAELTTGFHIMDFLLNSNITFEPRLGFKWNLRGYQTLTIGAGVHSRHEPISFYMTELKKEDGSVVMPNRYLRLTKAWHNVIGYDIFIKPDFHVKTEVYYQHLFDVPVDNKPDSRESILNYNVGITHVPQSNEGTGTNYGLEITVEKFFTRNYYFMITGSLFESKYKPSDGQTYNTLYNGNYIINFLAGKEVILGKRDQNLIGFNTRLLLKGGNRTTPILLGESINSGSTVIDMNNWMEDKLKDFFRWDAGVYFRDNRPTFSWIFSIDIQNITDRQNINRRYYNPDVQKIQYIYLLGIVPVLNLRIEFGI